jgi:hypothetical protein
MQPAISTSFSRDTLPGFTGVEGVEGVKLVEIETLVVDGVGVSVLVVEEVVGVPAASQLNSAETAMRLTIVNNQRCNIVPSLTFYLKSPNNAVTSLGEYVTKTQ